MLFSDVDFWCARTYVVICRECLSCQRGVNSIFPNSWVDSISKTFERGSPLLKGVKNPLKILLKLKTNFHFFLILKPHIDFLGVWIQLSSVHIILKMWRKHTTYLFSPSQAELSSGATAWRRLSPSGRKFWFSGVEGRTQWWVAEAPIESLPPLNSTEDGSLDGDPKIYSVHLFYYS